ncbi:hypothetical protein AA309_20315 [Microvirga vignae]|uniref:DUF6894 domain-containing protein n=1 Tax=Microvirga vignae TaxID=1225564 RepID=A0A0H1R8R5_9HYPH|nr:hypothetical protein [Microvirga vignae]KLK91439.1 hypothetical protein AA309_20315 [Microvirga vignae]
MRCFFHLVSTHESILDDTGIEFADLAAMQHEAARAIYELRQDDHNYEANWRDWQLNVVDEAGTLLMSVRLDMPPA